MVWSSPHFVAEEDPPASLTSAGMAGVYPHTWFILSLRNEKRASWCWVSTLLTSFHLQQVGYFLKDALCLYHTLLMGSVSKQETSAETGDFQILPWDILRNQDLRWVRVASDSLSSKLQDPPCCLEIQLRPFPTPHPLQAS